MGHSAIFVAMRALLWIILLWPVAAIGQSATIFPDTRLLMGHTTGTLQKGILEFRVAHRFGDIAGADGGWETFYGIEEAADIRIAFEYGITNRLMAGIGRTKGTGPAKRLIEGMLKFQWLTQEKSGMPLSVAVVGNTVLSTMPATADPSLVSHFPRFDHRLSFMLQGVLSRTFGTQLSLLLRPTLLHRNYVNFKDQNTTYYLGGGVQWTIFEGWSLLADYFYAFQTHSFSASTYTNPLAVGLSYETGGGHIFSVGLSNGRGLLENDYLPYTTEKWQDGEFRFGFRIVRKFLI